jgi:hypothetical protein
MILGPKQLMVPFCHYIPLQWSNWNNLTHDVKEVIDLCFCESRTLVSTSLTTTAMTTSSNTTLTSSLIVHQKKRLNVVYLIAAHLLKQKIK